MILSPIFPNIPDELKQYSQRVNWRSVLRRKDDSKPTKPPYQPNGQLAKTDDSLTWSTFPAVESASPQHDGIGFVLTRDDPFVGLDFDNCRCPALDDLYPVITSGLNMVLPQVEDYVRRLNSYTEISPSCKGIRIFLRGMLPVDGKRKGPIEVYQSGRYLTVTGRVVEGFPQTIENRQEALDTFCHNVFGATEETQEQAPQAHTETTMDDWRSLLTRAFQSQSGSAIKRLYGGDYSAYPSQSEADLGLCAHLAFWFSGDSVAIDSAFRESGLMREKWDERRGVQTYGEMTIGKAIEDCQSFYGDRQSQNFSYAVCNKSGSGKINHLQVAKDVVAKLGEENLAFVGNLRIFRKWNGQAWDEIDDRSICKAIVEYLGNKTQGVTKNVIESITDLIRTNVFRQGVTWDTDTGVIPVKNGELAWNDKAWILNPHGREHYRTTLIPFEYDPEARAPRFEQFLEEVFRGDSDVIEKSILICEMIGYTLTTSCEYEKFILLIGPGANGKSVLLDVIRVLTGPGQVAAVQPDQMDNRFQRAHLCGKLANIVTEIKEGGEIADAALKAITSGELMTAEHKFKKPFDFKPFSTCWFGTNHMPHTRDFSDALFRRALIVEFNRVFQEHEQDKCLKRKLADELPGILNLALTAFGGVIQRGQFTIPESCDRAKGEWRTEADQVAQFVNEQCTLDKNASVPSGVLYSTYRSWAEAAGISRMLNKINFSKRVQRLGGKLDRTGKSRMIDRIRLTQGED